MQTTSSPLDQLADIHLPASVSWWPLAIGWWILFAIILIGIGGYFYWRKKQLRNHYRQVATTELQAAFAQLKADPNNTAGYLQSVSLILRRTALTAQPTNFHSDVKGEEWLRWLDENCPALPQGKPATTSQQNFSAGVGRALLIGPYQKCPEFDQEALHSLCLLWIAKHRNRWQKNVQAPKVSASEKSTQAVDNSAEAKHV
jgi:hypothetical protein